MEDDMEIMDLEEEDQDNDWGDWGADDNEEDESEPDLPCLFCDSKLHSCEGLFQHCCSFHHFDFITIRKALSLDFYGAFKLINFVRSRVSFRFFSQFIVTLGVRVSLRAQYADLFGGDSS